MAVAYDDILGIGSMFFGLLIIFILIIMGSNFKFGASETVETTETAAEETTESYRPCCGR